MILGIGTDITEIRHFQDVIQKTPRLLERVFCLSELENAKKTSVNKQLSFFAKRFAAKEAISKACGTGIGADISWQDIEIFNDSKGAPYVVLSPKVLSFLRQKFSVLHPEILLSLSDESSYVVAFAILIEKNKKNTGQF